MAGDFATDLAAATPDQKYLEKIQTQKNPKHRRANTMKKNTSIHPSLDLGEPKANQVNSTPVKNFETQEEKAWGEQIEEDSKTEEPTKTSDELEEQARHAHARSRQLFMKKNPFQSPKHANVVKQQIEQPNLPIPDPLSQSPAPFAKQNQRNRENREKREKREKHQKQAPVAPPAPVVIQKSSVTLNVDSNPFSWDTFSQSELLDQMTKDHSKKEHDETVQDLKSQQQQTQNPSEKKVQPQKKPQNVVKSSTNIVKTLLSTNNLEETPALQPRGLNNINNSCYMNAVMQALLFLPDFYCTIRAIGKRILQFKIGEKTNDDTEMWFKNEFPYFYHVNRFFEIFSTIPKKNAASSNYIGTAAPFSPTEFFEFVGPKFQKKTQGGGSSQGEFWAHSGINANQEDVHEFLMFLVDCLHEEALKFEDLEKIRQEGLGKANYFEKTEQDENAEGWQEIVRGGKKPKGIFNVNEITFRDSPLSREFSGKLRSMVQYFTVRISKNKKVSNLTLRARQNGTATLQPFFSLHLPVDHMFFINNCLNFSEMGLPEYEQQQLREQFMSQLEKSTGSSRNEVTGNKKRINSILDAMEVMKSKEIIETMSKTANSSQTTSNVIEKNFITKQILFEELPKCLILHLKRFTHCPSNSSNEDNQKETDNLTFESQKLSQKVAYPFYLRIDPEMFSYSSEKSPNPHLISTLSSDSTKKEESRKFSIERDVPQVFSDLKKGLLYELYAVITHHGNNPSVGHYSTYLKHPLGKWCHLDDNNMTVVSPQHVLQQQGYVLLYKKIENCSKFEKEIVERFENEKEKEDQKQEKEEFCEFVKKTMNYMPH